MLKIGEKIALFTILVVGLLLLIPGCTNSSSNEIVIEYIDNTDNQNSDTIIEEIPSTSDEAAISDINDVSEDAVISQDLPPQTAYIACRIKGENAGCKYLDGEDEISGSCQRYSGTLVCFP